MESELERLRAENTQMQEKLSRVGQIRVWRNEDGKGFIFADDLKAVLLENIPEEPGFLRSPSRAYTTGATTC